MSGVNYWAAIGTGPTISDKGVWASGSQYNNGDIVNYLGIEYLALQPSLGITPPPPTLPVTFAYAAPACRAYRTTNQTLTTGTDTPISFDGERFDTDNIHDPATNPTRLTCKTAGRYIITGHVAFTPNAGGNNRQVNIRLNGSTVIASDIRPSSSAASNNRVSISAIYDLAVGDYVELSCYQDTGGNLDVINAANYSPEFEMARVNDVAGGFVISAGTSLPANPFDGMEYDLVDSLATPVYAWRCRYVAAITDAYKWVVVGGAPIEQRIAAAESTASTTFIDLTTVGPQIVVPRTGLYHIDWAFCLATPASSGNFNGQSQLYDNGVLMSSTAVASCFCGTIVGTNGYARQTLTNWTLTAGHTVKQMYAVPGGVNFTFSNRTLVLTPIRIS